MARANAEKADLLPCLAEVFRTYGYEGASLALISQATGLGKGSLYHFFPGGKQEMAEAVLTEIDAWFTASIFTPLRTTPNAAHAITNMFAATAAYFQSGQKICLLGLMGLSETRDRFAQCISLYFQHWITALQEALLRLGHDAHKARTLAIGSIAAIQGALVLARALNHTDTFNSVLAQAEQACLTR